MLFEADVLSPCVMLFEPDVVSAPVLCQAALEALDGLDLFGSRGGPSSVIHIMEDELQQCNVRGRGGEGVRGERCEGVRMLVL